MAEKPTRRIHWPVFLFPPCCFPPFDKPAFRLFAAASVFLHHSPHVSAGQYRSILLFCMLLQSIFRDILWSTVVDFRGLLSPVRPPAGVWCGVGFAAPWLSDRCRKRSPFH